MLTAELEAQFWAKVDRWDPDHCWPWNARLTDKGYALFFAERKRGRPAHRIAYELLIGPIPGGLVIDHLCRVRHCVNPAHMEPVTHRENILRGVGPSAMHAKATHCPQGHPYDDENTYRHPRGGRQCKICRRRRDQARLNNGNGEGTQGVRE